MLGAMGMSGDGGMGASETLFYLERRSEPSRTDHYSPTLTTPDRPMRLNMMESCYYAQLRLSRMGAMSVASATKGGPW